MACASISEQDGVSLDVELNQMAESYSLSFIDLHTTPADAIVNFPSKNVCYGVLSHLCGVSSQQ